MAGVEKSGRSLASCTVYSGQGRSLICSMSVSTWLTIRNNNFFTNASLGVDKYIKYMRTEVLKKVKISVLFFWVTTLCGLVDIYQHTTFIFRAEDTGSTAGTYPQVHTALQPRRQTLQHQQLYTAYMTVHRVWGSNNFKYYPLHSIPHSP
jgi:hypothetical protein